MRVGNPSVMTWQELEAALAAATSDYTRHCIEREMASRRHVRPGDFRIPPPPDARAR